MIPTDDKSERVDQRLLDLLADNELSPAERRELLLRLDTVPDGWRRCALALLEAQSWKEDFRAIARSAACPAVEGPRRRSLRSKLARLVPYFATAVSLAAALLLGFVGRDYWPTSGRPVERAVATSPWTSPDDIAAAGADPRSPWRAVTVSVGDPWFSGQPVRVPATERESIDEAWLRGFPEAIPRDVLGALERTGHRVENQRRLVPMPLQDGRNLVVPVDQVDIRYVGGPAYQ
jgi:hypothetical protein